MLRQGEKQYFPWIDLSEIPALCWGAVGRFSARAYAVQAIPARTQTLLRHDAVECGGQWGSMHPVTLVWVPGCLRSWPDDSDPIAFAEVQLWMHLPCSGCWQRHWGSVR